MFDERKKEKKEKEKKEKEKKEKEKKNGGFEGSTITSGDNGRVANIARWTIDAACFGQIYIGGADATASTANAVALFMNSARRRSTFSKQ